ncbi:hypothetical protein SH2C18_50150 [Clostridium sediminicola]|uniref:hypothetical protein n=1 Tax=Clostridium sediminicola TaxID=3114879 RepID=UPI0031F22761
MTQKDNKTIVCDLIEKNSIDGLDELCATNFIGHLPTFPDATTKDGFLGFAQMLFTVCIWFLTTLRGNACLQLNIIF